MHCSNRVAAGGPAGWAQPSAAKARPWREKRLERTARSQAHAFKVRYLASRRVVVYPLQLMQLCNICVCCLALLLCTVPHRLRDLECAGNAGDGARGEGESDLNGREGRTRTREPSRQALTNDVRDHLAERCKHTKKEIAGTLRCNWRRQSGGQSSQPFISASAVADL